MIAALCPLWNLNFISPWKENLWWILTWVELTILMTIFLKGNTIEMLSLFSLLSCLAIGHSSYSVYHSTCLLIMSTIPRVLSHVEQSIYIQHIHTCRCRVHWVLILNLFFKSGEQRAVVSAIQFEACEETCDINKLKNYFYWLWNVSVSW